MAKKSKKSQKTATSKRSGKKVATRSAKTTTKTAPKFDGRTNAKSWSKDDLKQLKTLIKQNTPTRLIALKLKRTEGATRAKVHKEGMSLRPTNRSPRD